MNQMRKVRLLVPFVISDKPHKKGAIVPMTEEEIAFRLSTGEVELVDKETQENAN